VDRERTSRGRRRWRGEHPWFARARRRDERGAVAVFVAAVLVVLLAITAIVIDLGMERVTARDLQSMADVVALDLAREIQGQPQSQLEGEGNFQNPASAVRQSAARNPDVLGDNLNIEVDWGSYDGVWNTATNPPTAVRVIASADTDYSVMSGSGDVTRTAYASSASSACYKLGTFVAAIRSGDSTVLGPLNYLLDVNLHLVSYQALANANVTLGDLAATATFGSPQELLTGTVSYADLISALIEVLSNQPGSDSVAISALGSIRASAGALGAIALGDVLHVAPTDTAALGMDLSVLDIVGSARLLTGEHFLEINNLQAGVPGVGFQFTGGLTLISAAQLACGAANSAESIAQNAQLSGTLGIQFVNLPSLNLPHVGTLQTARGSGSLTVNLADGQGQLVSPPEVHCGDGTPSDPHSYSVAVQTQPASYSLSADLEINGELKVSALQGLGLGGLLSGLFGLLLPNAKLSIDVKVRVEVAAGEPGGTSLANLTIPPNDVTPVETGSAAYIDPRNIVPTVTEVKIGGSTVPLAGALPLANAIVSELTNAGDAFVQKTLIPLIDNFNNELIGPVARMVGLRFGGADVYAVGAVCGEPSLTG